MRIAGRETKPNIELFAHAGHDAETQAHAIAIAVKIIFGRGVVLFKASAEIAAKLQTSDRVGNAGLGLERVVESFVRFLAQFVGFLGGQNSFLNQFIDQRVGRLRMRRGAAGHGGDGNNQRGQFSFGGVHCILVGFSLARN